MSVASLRLPMSATTGLRGDASRANPEQLLVVSLSACQALTYLFLAAKQGILVAGYEDEAEGHLSVAEGRVRMGRVKLRPRITLVSGADEDKARELIEPAHRQCLIANSVNTRIEIEATLVVAAAAREAVR